MRKNKEAKLINVVVRYLDPNQEEVERKNFSIESDNYDLLMSDSPAFAPGKPGNEYREVDLWHIIDILG